LKYWTRQPYLGFGVDAHSMLMAADDLRSQRIEAVRFATPDSLEGFSAPGTDPSARAGQVKASQTLIDEHAALEESFFLGLRLNRGVSVEEFGRHFGSAAIDNYQPIIDELAEAVLLKRSSNRFHLTPRGRLLSNEVFERFLRDRVPADRR
jgi:oxygen-independent coproporphyrinogen-3 oxidase